MVNRLQSKRFVDTSGARTGRRCTVCDHGPVTSTPDGQRFVTRATLRPDVGLIAPPVIDSVPEKSLPATGII